jgi:hypothetical protein
VLRAIVPATAAILLAAVVLAPLAEAATDLSYEEYQRIARVAHRLLHVTMFEPLEGEPGMNVAIGDRYNTVNVYYLTEGTGERTWRSRALSGVVEELIVMDADGDGLDDTLVARTNAGRIYAWSLADYRQIFESLPGDYERITCFTTGNVDDDPQNELVINADRRIYYVDGVTGNRDFTSLSEYEATEVRCGDVDGDDRVELVLNTGQVLDGLTAEVEWAEEVFGQRIELLDYDGDGILEIFTESDGGFLRVFNVDYRREARFQ